MLGNRQATLKKVSLLLMATRQEPRGQLLIKHGSHVHNILLTVKTYVPTSASASGYEITEMYFFSMWLAFL